MCHLMMKLLHKLDYHLPLGKWSQIEPTPSLSLSSVTNHVSPLDVSLS